ADARGAAADHRLRPQGPPGARDHRLLLGPQRAGAVAVARLRRPVHHRLPYPAPGRALPQPPPPQHPVNHRPRGPRRLPQWRDPHLANTLETIGREGRDAFYKGEIARRIDAYFRDNGGFLRYEDLAAHQGEWVEPVSTTYRGVEVWELPPNGQGIAALQMLNILEGYDFSDRKGV